LKKLIIATRGSKLALWQSEHIKSVLEATHEGLEVELNVIVTTGDKIIDKPLSQIGGKGLFLKELEEAMLRGEAHIAVHSLKDVPTVMPEGFTLAAITKREDSRDALLSQKYKSIEDLPQKAVVGTSSLRRKMQLALLRPDLIIKDLRGNVDTRIRKLKEGEYDAIILATAGISRLGLTQNVEYFSPIELDTMVPSMGQGALGIEAIDDEEVIKIAQTLEDDAARIETTIERAFVDKLEGGCQVPIGVSAKLQDDAISVRAILGLPDGSEILSEEKVVKKSAFEGIGEAMADALLERGAKELLERAEIMAAKQ